jgi:hypothetical protein
MTVLDVFSVWHSARKMAEFNLEPYAHYIKPIDVYAVPREYLIQATLLNDVNGAVRATC